MKEMRVYVKTGKAINLDRMRQRLGNYHDMSDAVITEINSDPLGVYYNFVVPDTVSPKELKYRGVKKVLDVTPSMVPSLFKAYVDGDVIDSFDDMWRRFDLELKKSGTEKTGLFKREKNYMIFEGSENVHPEQIQAYPGIVKAVRIDQYIVDIARNMTHGRELPETMHGLSVSIGKDPTENE
ncbi:MAG: hypothetical protein J7K54_00575 [Candidatus Aenigmarchaeota archaeon]|nr:hypothetical protein [Candidatus Aenigmarchaeota archaeon]